MFFDSPVKHSKTLADIVKKKPEIYSGYEAAPSGHWVHLRAPYIHSDKGTTSFRDETVKGVLEQIKCYLALGVNEGHAWRPMEANEVFAWNHLSDSDRHNFGELNIADRMVWWSEYMAGEKVISGSVRVSVRVGMKARINPECFEGRKHKGKEFVVSGEPRELCGTEVVALDNLDGSRFSPAYDLSMLQITDTGE